jgi:hypothetical protein
LKVCIPLLVLHFQIKTWIADCDNNPGLHVAQVRAIFTLPEHLQVSCVPNHLAFVDWFTSFRHPEKHSGLHSVSRAQQNMEQAAEIVSLDDIVCTCYLIPKGNPNWDPKWTTDNAYEECSSFYFNHYMSLASFYSSKIKPVKIDQTQ